MAQTVWTEEKLHLDAGNVNISTYSLRLNNGGPAVDCFFASSWVLALAWSHKLTLLRRLASVQHPLPFNGDAFSCSVLIQSRIFNPCYNQIPNIQKKKTFKY